MKTPPESHSEKNEEVKESDQQSNVVEIRRSDLKGMIILFSYDIVSSDNTLTEK